MHSRRYADVDVASWRDAHAPLASRAAFVIAPSRWAATMFARYFARRTIERSSRMGRRRRRTARPAGTRLGVLLPDDDVPSSRSSAPSGRTRARAASSAWSRLMRARGVPLRLVVIGYLDIERGPWQSDDAVLTVHGRYDAGDLPELLRTTARRSRSFHRKDRRRSAIRSRRRGARAFR